MKVVKNLSLATLLVVALGFLTIVVTQPYFLSDWLTLRNYQPPERIVAIADSTTMTESARKLFYVHTPSIEDSATFNQHCTIKEASIVLGCYDGRDIYVFDVTDERLKGVHEVTAAHEMLHVAYDRLSDSERKEVDVLTTKQFRSITDTRIRATVEAYRSRDPSVVVNELHSILATEVRTLEPDLENYYKRYFNDRLKVVAFSEGYEQIFTDIKTKVERYDSELTLLKAQIDSLEQDLESRANIITSERDRLNTLLAQNDISSYNQLVPDYNFSVQQYNVDLDRYKILITEYNQKVAERNASTVEQNNLIDSLSSQATEL
jgi:hypothetical protein